MKHIDYFVWLRLRAVHDRDLTLFFRFQRLIYSGTAVFFILKMTLQKIVIVVVATVTVVYRAKWRVHPQPTPWLPHPPPPVTSDMMFTPVLHSWQNVKILYILLFSSSSSCCFIVYMIFAHVKFVIVKTWVPDLRPDCTGTHGPQTKNKNLSFWLAQYKLKKTNKETTQ